MTCLHAGVQEIAEPEAASIVHGEVGIAVANQYITRGFVVQDDGTSFQPHLDLSVTFFDGDGFFNSASAFIGLWSAIGSTPYESVGRDGSRHTEFDYGLGVSISFAERWMISSYYNRWTSPAGAYNDGHWINATLEFDDHGLFPATFSLEPFLQIAHEFGSDLAPGLSFEPGIRPNVTFFPESDSPVNAGLLVMAGLGRGYFGVDYGYFAIGPQMSVPLGFIDPSAGSWTVYAECLYYDFGKITTAENGQDHTWLISIKLAVAF
ncbi:hypothetical protein DES53_101984 [Roseimicrobium gellanilyticum]|uniref:Uncharacterized protein n=1 Tax=Roseimicrobium gellanilyticum TaxID=748857 RepID=A0A366HX98_9BACT|nr:hypothetical protein [Roseimicrobium gellanilyticum]RBP48184.1 hypothetical protein DES53_101984 [Roseimicrobium gellanilyticum]